MMSGVGVGGSYPIGDTWGPGDTRRAEQPGGRPGSAAGWPEM